MHGLGEFEVDLAATAGITALGHLRVDLECWRNGIRRNGKALLLLEKELFGSGELGIVECVERVAVIRGVLSRRDCGPANLGLSHFEGSASGTSYL